MTLGGAEYAPMSIAHIDTQTAVIMVLCSYKWYFAIRPNYLPYNTYYE